MLEFKGVNDLNEWFDTHKTPYQFEIIPVPRMFQHPVTKEFVNSITYVLVKD